MIRFIRLAGLAALAILSASPAFAQVPDRVGMFGHIDGHWMWLGAVAFRSTRAAPTNEQRPRRPG
jgi:hypothetical protein